MFTGKKRKSPAKSGRVSLRLEMLEPRLLLSASGYALGTLTYFDSPNSSLPVAGLIRDGHGNLFGTTPAGGTNNAGTVFEIPAGSSQAVTLASFLGRNGSDPQSSLLLDGSGNLYGTTEYGGADGYGTAFEIAAGSGTISLLASFNGANGSSPVSALVMDGGGNLYGTTEYGGAKDDGTVYEIAAGSDTVTTLASFNGLNGSLPVGALALDGGGNLYGATEYGGAENDGTVFELKAGATAISPVASFLGTNGADPRGGVILDGSGNVYGTTEYGGTKDDGTVFEIASGSATIAALASFAGGAQGALPLSTPALDGSGNLYGTTTTGGAKNDGTVFEWTAGAATITPLASFVGTNGADPKGAVVLDGSGNLYGTTEYGGNLTENINGSITNVSLGTVFEVAAGSGAITTLTSFTANNGSRPLGGLVMDANGNIYGTTAYGGLENYGTVFEIAAGSDTVTTLASFATQAGGTQPRGSLFLDSSGNLYGTTENGGAYNDGAVFELKAGASTITTLASFDGTDGREPRGGVVMDAGGNLYGTTEYGGAQSLGTVFEIAAGSGTITTVASFAGADGSDPRSALILDSGGNLYGTAAAGGAHNDGTVFEIAAGSGAITTLASFNGTNGASPTAGLVLDGSGNLYGTTQYGGAHNFGTVFEVVAGSNTITLLASFNGANGENPSTGLIMDASGNLYGTAPLGGEFDRYEFDYGTVFEIAAGSGTITRLASFSNRVVLYGGYGASPETGLVMDAKGNIYGTTEYGGAHGVGTLFELTAPPAKLAFVLPLAAVQAGGNLPVTVDVENAAGGVVAGDDSYVTLTISRGALYGTLTERAVNGVATFSNLSITAAGTYTLTASDSDDYLTNFVSGSFTVTSAAASKLVFVRQPSNAAAGATLTPPVVVDIEDVYGNLVTSDDSDVTLTISTGALDGTPTEQAVAGVATFSGLSVPAPGIYTLRAGSDALTAVSRRFTINTAKA